MGKSPLDLGPVTVWLQGDGSLPRHSINALDALLLCLLLYGAVFVTAFHCDRGWRKCTSLLRKFIEKITGGLPTLNGKLLALFGLWLVTLFKLLVPTATWAKHFLVLVAMTGVFELCLLATIATLVLLALIELLAARLCLAAFGRAELFGLRRACVVDDQPNGLESQLLHSDKVANKE